MITALRRSVALLSLLAASAYQPALSQRIANARDERSGIAIDFSSSETIFPEEWRTEDVAAKATPMRRSERERTARLIEQAMAVYPLHVLKDNLKEVHLVGVLEFYGLMYGGTNSRDAIYISNLGTPNFTDDALRGAFHHEFSSILLRNNPKLFDSARWKAGLPEGFKYGTGGIDALRNGTDDLSYQEKYNKDGFLNQYGESDIEEDFNTFAEGMLAGRKTFWAIVDKFPLVAKKMKVIVDFYHALDPSFTEESLRALAKE